MATDEINDEKCWSEVYKLIADDEIGRAMALCESDPYARTITCQRFLGWQYYKMNDLESALKWFKKVADKDDADAMFGIGCVHWVLEDMPLTIFYCQKAADKGYARACYWLGRFYSYGLGVPQNDDIAINWYGRAAAQGLIIAKKQLLHLACKKGGVIAKIRTFPCRIRLFMEFLWIASKDIHDPRLCDIPNEFEKYLGNYLNKGRLAKYPTLGA